MSNLLKIDKEIRAYLRKKYTKMRYEIEQYIKGEINLKDISKESEQILRKLGIYYKKEIYKWDM